MSLIKGSVFYSFSSRPGGIYLAARLKQSEKVLARSFLWSCKENLFLFASFFLVPSFQRNRNGINQLTFSFKQQFVIILLMLFFAVIIIIFYCYNIINFLLKKLSVYVDRKYHDEILFITLT